MRERLERLERRVEELSSRVDDLWRELRGRPAESSPSGETARAAPPSAPAAGPPAEDWAISRGVEDLVARHRLVLLAGLVSLALAGAMVLRTVTLASPVPLTLGAGFGLLYCGFLLLVAERKLRRGVTLHGDVFAILAAAILGTLLVEVTHRPRGFSRETSYLVLGVFLAVHSFQALRRGRAAPFAVGLFGAPVAGLAIGGTPFLHPDFAAVLGVTVLAAGLASRRNGWGWAPWGPAAVSLLYLLVLGGIATAAARRDLPQHLHARPLPALAIAAGFFLLLVLPPTAAVLVRRRKLSAFEIFASVAAAIACYGVSAAALTALPSGELVTGVAGLGLGAFFYTASFQAYERHGAESGGFYALSAIGLLYAGTSLALLLADGARGAAWQALGLALAFLAARLGKRSLSFQAHVLTFAALADLALSTFSLSPPAAGEAGRLAGAGWLLASGTLAVAVFARLRSFRLPGDAFRLSRLSFAATARLLVLAAGAAEIVAGATPFLHTGAVRLLAVPPGGPEAAALWHSAETLLLVAAALGTLALGVRIRAGAVTVLAVALMALAGIKLFLFDVMALPTPHVVCSAAVFGLALILSSFLYRRFRGLEGTSPETAAAPLEVHE